MIDSILNNTKKQLGIAEDYTVFDPDIIMDINAVFMILYQMGVGPSTPFSISDTEATTTDIFTSDGETTDFNLTYKPTEIDLVTVNGSEYSGYQLVNENTIRITAEAGDTIEVTYTYISIPAKAAVWSDFIGTKTNINAIKTYMYMKVRMMFDPPVSSGVVDALNRNIEELEWRLNNGSDYEETFVEGEG